VLLSPTLSVWESVNEEIIQAMINTNSDKNTNSTRLHRSTLLLLGYTIILLGCTANTPLETAACSPAEHSTSRLFLQQVSSKSAIVRWRGEANTVCIGTSADKLDIAFSAELEGGHKQVKLTGLKADTQYFYSTGNANARTNPQFFKTAPLPGSLPRDGNTHIWLLGDSGTASEVSHGKFKYPGEALAVKNGFLKYNQQQANGEDLDLILLLGDNAYREGTDAQWQAALFELYRDELARTVVWPTIGNHEMGTAYVDTCSWLGPNGCDAGPKITLWGGVSLSSDPASYDSDGDGPDAGGMPYLNIFNLPGRAQNGGVPSGTELYYSFDHANVHVVSLDSQLSNRDESRRAAMREWLVDDLAANNQDWTVVIFHHPPYTKGQHHDSDKEQAEIDMRRSFVSVFEDYAVDVVYSGHAHSYERSWYLHGHYGQSDTFDPQLHAELDSSGKPSLGQGNTPYQQISASTDTDDKAVFTVAGSSGKITRPCESAAPTPCSLGDWLSHPAHRTFDADLAHHRPHGISIKGSVVLDAGEHSLTSRFIDENGEVRDMFTITRD
jgi:hypothetical protein